MSNTSLAFEKNELIVVHKWIWKENLTGSDDISKVSLYLHCVTCKLEAPVVQETVVSGQSASMTQSEATGNGSVHVSCRGCWPPPGPSLFHHTETGPVALWMDRLVPVHLEQRWVFCWPFELTSLSWPEQSQDLSVPIKRVTQQLSLAWWIIAILHGERNCPSAQGAPLFTNIWCPWPLATTRSSTLTSKQGAATMKLLASTLVGITTEPHKSYPC